MTAAEIYAELLRFGFEIKTPNGRIDLVGTSDVPAHLQEAIKADRESFYAYVVEVEEMTAQLLDYDKSNTEITAAANAKKCVDDRRMLESEDVLFTMTRKDPTFKNFSAEYLRVFGRIPKLVDVEIHERGKIAA